MMVNGLLVKSFPDIVSTDFTAQMEEQLDQVEDGTADWVKLLKTFYAPFKIDLDKAKVEMRDVKREEQKTDEVCEKCGKPMVIKWGRNGALPRLLRLPRLPQHQGVHAQLRRQPHGAADDAAVGPALPDVQRADGDPARALRRVPGVLALPRLQDDAARCRWGSPAPRRGAADTSRKSVRSVARCSSDARTTRRPSATSCRGIVRSRSPARPAARRSSSRRSARPARACAASSPSATTRRTPRPRPRPRSGGSEAPPATAPQGPASSVG